jgi:putative addiction module component (TIGR02574 family)
MRFWANCQYRWTKKIALTLFVGSSTFTHMLARFPKLTKLPRRQRLALAEELWFSGVDDSFPVGPIEQKILDERWNAYQAGKTKRISLNEIERRLKRK